MTKYPLEARIKANMGQVIVSFLVNEDGTTSDYSVLKDIGGNCGNAVIEAYKANTKRRIPEIYNGQKVKVRLYQTVTFEAEIDWFGGLAEATIIYE